MTNQFENCVAHKIRKSACSLKEVAADKWTFTNIFEKNNGRDLCIY